MKRSVLKWSAIFSIVLVIVLAVTLFPRSSDPKPSVLAADTRQIVIAVKASSNSTFEEIQRNIDMVSELKAGIGSSSDLARVIKQLEAVTASYESLASRRDSIRKDLMNQVSSIQDMQAKIDSRVKELRDKRASYASQLATTNDPDPQIAATRRESLKRAIEYVDQQLALWSQFRKIQSNISYELADISSKIDRYLAMIQDTSVVFREGLNLLKLQRDINQAASLLSNDIPTLEQQTADMQRSWDDLDLLISTLTNVATVGE